MRPYLAMLIALTLVAPARAQAPAAAATGTRYLVLVRHGAYDHVRGADPRVGDGLSPLGRAQARLVADRLARLGVRFTTLASSDFTRARETAAVIGARLRMPVVLDSMIHECTPATERADLMRTESPEDVAACENQLAAAWAKYARASPAADTHELLVCHGNVIRSFVGRALGLDSLRWTRMEIASASLTVLAVRGDGTTRLVMFSDAGHLPLDRQTWTARGAGWRRSAGSAPAR